jgi:uncharacterized repeat protein (TIGR01451 family)
VLNDSATLAGGYHPTGTVTFTLLQGTTQVFSTTVTVQGNHTYTTQGGFRLPPTGTATGTYQWNATYSGDGNNNAASDQGSTTEQVIVNPATPVISTSANPTTALPGTTLQDVANLVGGYHPTGSITFSLYAPGSNPAGGTPTYVETVNGVTGDGTYQTTTGFTSNAAGIWHWVATYNGDSNNQPIPSGALDEPVIVEPQADVALTKAVIPTQATVGSNVTYTLTVHNLGPNTADGVFVDDPIQPGLVFVSATASQGTYVPQTGIWMVGTLAVGASAVLQVTDVVQAVGTIINNAEAGSLQQDPNLNNNFASAIETATLPNPSKRSLLGSTFFDPPPQPTLPSLKTLRSDEAFVMDQYQYRLGRQADSAQLAYWVNELLLGVSRKAVERKL